MNKNPICSPQILMSNPIITSPNPNHMYHLLFQIPHHTTPDITSPSPTIQHHRPPTMSPSPTIRPHQPHTMNPNPTIPNQNPTILLLLTPDIMNPNLTIPHPPTMNQNPTIPLLTPDTMNRNLTTPFPTPGIMNPNPTTHPAQITVHQNLAQIMAHQNRTNLKVQSCLNIDHTNQKKSNQLPSQHMKLIPDLIVGKFRIRIAIMLIQKLDVLFIIIAMLMANKIHSIVLMVPFSMNIWEHVIILQQCFARVEKGTQHLLTPIMLPIMIPIMLHTMPPIM